MIYLKHLSREYNIAPYKLRQILRAEFGRSNTPHTYRKWKWDDETDNELLEIRDFLKKRGAASSASRNPSTHQPSAREKQITSAPASTSETASSASPAKTNVPQRDTTRPLSPKKSSSSGRNA